MTIPVTTSEVPKVPRFKILAGVGGILVYLLASLPIILSISLYYGIQHADDSSAEITKELEDLFSGQWMLVTILLAQCIGFFVYAFLVSQIRGSKNMRNDLGLRFTWDALYFILVGIGLQIIGILISLPIQLIQDNSSKQDVVQSFEDSSGLGIFVLMMLIAFIVPFTEEACFRGLFQRGLSKRCSPYVAVLISGIVFAAIHFADPSTITGGSTLLMVGLFAAALSMYRGRIDASICLHIGFNLTTVAIILALR